MSYSQNNMDNQEDWIDDNGTHHHQQEQTTNSIAQHEQPIGDGMVIPKPNNWTRIYCQNTNGISVGRDSDLEIILEQIKHMEADIMIITETNLATDNNNVRSKVYNKFRQTFGQATHRLVMATSPQKYPGYFKPGGVMGAVMGKTIARVIDSGQDYLGRWVYISLIGKENKRITIIGTYQVCQENIKTAGPTTTITQQYSILVQEGRQNPQRVRDHHAKDIIQFVKTRQELNEKVIVCGDFNDIIGEHNRGLTKLCSECKLKDVIFGKHGRGSNEFSTYARGNRCIDYILMDEDLIPATQACGYEPFNVHIMSDH